MPKTTPINGAWPAEQVRAAALVEERAIMLRLALIACFLLVVVPAAGAQTTIGTTRTYYIAADEVQWNYLPGGLDGMMGMKPAGHAKIYARHDAQTIGTVYRKAVYRAYTDATFTHLVPRSGANAYLGVLGPVLHAEVGDTIKVVFRNHASRPYSMHPHGVFYDKASEGAAYADGVDATAKNGDAVAPGKTFSYVWQVPERAGPGPNDPSSIAWFYHSHVDERRDIDAGLIGAIVVTRAGMARPDGTPKDVDHEFVALFMMFDENQSPYIDANIKQYVAKPKKRLKFDGGTQVDPNGNFDPAFGNGFASVNIRSTVNGYQYATMPMPTMKIGDHVRWYAMTIGEGFNFHTAHWHGNTVLVAGQRTDVIALAPAQTVTADMVPDDPGVWMFHCHVSEHMQQGMSAYYHVTP
jgi:FtsP/CotA-like multicopper oxidase with cupredoxin domain